MVCTMSPREFSVTVLLLLGIIHLPLLPGVEAQEACNNVGDIRLVGRVHSNILAGRLEVCLNGTVWGTVSNIGWDVENTRVVCRQLGVAEGDLDDIVAVNEILVSFGEGNSSQPVPIESVSCAGSENKLIDCQYTYNPNPSASHGTDVGVICQRAEACNATDVRLVGGATDTEGRVEVCVGGQWGTVCGDRRWDTDDVKVVCRQLGHFTLEPQLLTSVPPVGNTNTPIVLNQVTCSGKEDRLVDCERGTTVEGCNHADDAGANCTREIECTDNDVRLTNGGGINNRGIVEFCRNGYWGQICRGRDWDDQDAIVVCRQLGYDVENENARTSSPFQFRLGANFRRTWMSEVGCTGDEASLSQCNHTVPEGVLCIAPDAGVICPATRRATTTESPIATTVTQEEATTVPETSEPTEPSSTTPPVEVETTEASTTQGFTTPTVTQGFTTPTEGFTTQPSQGFTMPTVTGSTTGTPDNTTTSEVEDTTTAPTPDNVTQPVDITTTSAPTRTDDVTEETTVLLTTGTPTVEVTDKSTQAPTTLASTSTTAAAPTTPPPVANCTEGDVQLVGGVFDDILEGRLEVCLNGVWGTVCNDGWDLNDAKVVCRQLGVAEEDLNNVVTGMSFGGGPNTQPTHFEGLECSGSESSISECTHDGIGQHDCDKFEDVGIICQRANECSEPAVRLVGGENVTEGRVEVCIGGQWGTVCGGRGWVKEEAAVVCRQLGYFTLDPKVLSPVPRVDNLNVPIAWYSLSCSTEDSLYDCQRGKNVEGCSHINDAGANCTREIECVDDEVRLTNGDDNSEGIVEFCRSGYWGQVCEDPGWDDQDAKVVCRQLGFDVENGTVLIGTGFGLGDNFRRPWLNNVECSGDESSLSECSHVVPVEVGDCREPYASVICPVTKGTSTVEVTDESTQAPTTPASTSTTAAAPTTSTPVANCTEGDVQLVGGVFDNIPEGRLEVCLNGVWGSVCNDGWDLNDAKVVCRQLGVAEEDLGLVITGISFSGGPSRQPPHFEEAECDGTESRLIDCQYGNASCDSEKNEDVGIICQRADECTESDVRLVGGETDTEGRVEVCIGGQWGTVCGGRGWEKEEVAVVCKQIGHFTLEPQVLTPVPQVGNLNTPIVREQVSCSGREDLLVNCQSTTNIQGCSHTDDAGANCTREFECIDNDVRLTIGDENSGIVEFCRDGYWGQVCQSGWDDQDAKVVCRQLGFGVQNARKSGQFEFGFGDNFRRLWMSEVECSGDEASLSQCSHVVPTGVASCAFPNAGVMCPETQDVTTAMPTDASPQTAMPTTGAPETSTTATTTGDGGLTTKTSTQSTTGDDDHTSRSTTIATDTSNLGGEETTKGAGTERQGSKARSTQAAIVGVISLSLLAALRV